MMMKDLAKSDELKDMREGLNNWMGSVASHITKVEYKVDALETKVAMHSAVITQMRPDNENLKHGGAAAHAQPFSTASASSGGA